MPPPLMLLFWDIIEGDCQASSPLNKKMIHAAGMSACYLSSAVLYIQTSLLITFCHMVLPGTNRLIIPYTTAPSNAPSMVTS